MHIASLEDDPAQRELLQLIVTQAGYRCTTYEMGRDFLSVLAKPNDFSLLLVDWELPDITGFDVLRWIRTHLGHSVPVIFITNRGQEADLVAALQAGADDYLIKPVRAAELQARIQALLRRTTSLPVQETPFQCAAYSVDPHNARIELNGRPIDLAPKEFELALLFLRNPGHLFSRDVLSNTVWNRDIPATSRTIDTHLSNIRRKLQLRPHNGVRLTASYALGYRLELLGDEEQTQSISQ